MLLAIPQTQSGVLQSKYCLMETCRIDPRHGSAMFRSFRLCFSPQSRSAWPLRPEVQRHTPCAFDVLSAACSSAMQKGFNCPACHCDGQEYRPLQGFLSQGLCAGEVNRPGSRSAPSSDDPETVQAEAVAAAALALNKVCPLLLPFPETHCKFQQPVDFFPLLSTAFSGPQKPLLQSCGLHHIYKRQSMLCNGPLLKYRFSRCLGQHCIVTGGSIHAFAGVIDTLLQSRSVSIWKLVDIESPDSDCEAGLGDGSWRSTT